MPRTKTRNLKAVQSLLGHATINSSQRYAHVLASDLREALEDASDAQSPHHQSKRGAAE